jgi:general secretion pathway protein E
MTSTAAPTPTSDPDLRSLSALSDAFPAEYLDYYAVLPLEVEDGRLRVATWVGAVDPQALDDLRLSFRAEPELVRLPEAEVRAAIQRIYGSGSTAEALVADLDPGEVAIASDEVPLDDLRSQANEAPVVRLVNLLILEAMEARASDVHLEGHARGLQVRYRIDGILQDAPTPPAHLRAAVVSRIKIMAELDIAERRAPQDGRIRLRLRDRDVDVRVSVVPTLHGESVVLRILDRERGRVALDSLGMGEETLRCLDDAIGKPQGVVLATGPTGSGKTTTLYATLEQLRTGREKILTVEDPIEYELLGIAQMPVNRKVGVTFATALRALLRQDPDILLVGEIRDGETAQIATHAALTGHLVLSTLHTNDATSAVTRLVDLGVADYLVASTVECVLAQRLVRCVCGVCAEEVTLEEGWSAALGDPPAGLETVPRATGCDACRGTGYRGRIGIFELLVFDDDLREALRERPDARHLRRLAIEDGLRTLRDDGLRQIAAGVTTPEEVLRVTLV